MYGYEREGRGHAQHQGFQQLYSYGIDHMDAPIQEEQDRSCYQNINLTPQRHIIKQLYICIQGDNV